MIHENEICPEFLFTPREDMEQDEELLKQAMDGLKSLEKEAINDLNRAKVRAYKSMIEQAGYEVHTNSTIGDYVEFLASVLICRILFFLMDHTGHYCFCQ